MLFTLAASALLALLPTAAQAVGRAIVTNQCDGDVYLWSVGSNIGPKVKIPKASSYSEVFHVDPRTGGIALKMTAVDNGLFMPNVSQTIFSYNLDGTKIWYDLSDVFVSAVSMLRALSTTNAARVMDLPESLSFWRRVIPRALLSLGLEEGRLLAARSATVAPIPT
jgi:hypothetical protein